MSLTKSQKGTLGAMIVIALLGIIIAIILTVSFIGDKALSDIKENGTQTNATVTSSQDQRDSDGNLSGYKYTYTYLDAASGNTYTGSTHNSVSNIIEVGNTISIYYVGDKSVEASFSPMDMGIIFIPAGVALIGIIGIVVVCLQGRGRGLIMKRGHDGQATFVSYEIGRTYQPTRTYTNGRGVSVTVPNGPAIHYYKVRYLWNADNGKQIEGVSPSDYSLEEAQRFQKAAKFNIRSFANKSIVMGVPQVQVAEAVAQPKEEVKKSKFCEYCGAKLEEGKNSCPGCGKQY
ncbi:MAG: zinc ribbon domain-containing protein [Christensenellaceae bacterium]|nr:zinc ribbon domain-containing protein [Christensenellaceae bacterium]